MNHQRIQKKSEKRTTNPEPIEAFGAAETLQIQQTPVKTQPLAGLSEVLTQVERRLKTAHRNHFGYPYNLVGNSQILARFGKFLVNNLGDPETGSHYASEVCDLEREAVHWLMNLWQCDDRDRFWGSVGASGTEGNLWALYLAREAHPEGVLIYSDEAHYSIPKAARILGLDSRSVRCRPNGEIEVAALAEVLQQVRNRPLILALTCGTTVKGTRDDIVGAMRAVDDAGFDSGRRYVQVDGALNAMVLPFISECPSAILPSFKSGVDSISTSGHKMIGTPMPCGVLITKREHVQRVASSIAYLRSNDTTLMGSRNGHAVLAVWSRLSGHGSSGFKRDIEECLKKTDQLVAELTLHSVPVLRNRYSLTVVFPQPSEEVVMRYQLACHQGESHAIVMPSVTDGLIGRFLQDYLNWWNRQ